MGLVGVWIEIKLWDKLGDIVIENFVPKLKT